MRVFNENEPEMTLNKLGAIVLVEYGLTVERRYVNAFDRTLTQNLWDILKTRFSPGVLSGPVWNIYDIDVCFIRTNLFFSVQWSEG